MLEPMLISPGTTALARLPLGRFPADRAAGTMSPLNLLQLFLNLVS